VVHEIDALLRGEERECDPHELHDLIERSRTRGAEEGLQFREGQFNRIEIGTVGRQKAEMRAGLFDGRAHRGLLVHYEVVEDDNIARPQGRDQHLLDIRTKRGIVDRAIEDRRRADAIDAQAGNDRVRLPVTERRVVPEPDAARAASIAAQEIRGDARFIEEDIVARVAEREHILPTAAGRGHVRPALFVGVYGFF
jgi:hypothetical protein